MVLITFYHISEEVAAFLIACILDMKVSDNVWLSLLLSLSDGLVDSDFGTSLKSIRSRVLVYLSASVHARLLLYYIVAS